MALMPYAAGVENGGLVVRAEAGAAGGGVLVITGRVPDDSTLARLAADATASIAPPFTVETALDVGLQADSSSVATATAPRTVVLSLEADAEDAAADVRAVLADNVIAFRPGTAELADGTRETLERLATVLADHPEIAIEVAGAGEGSGSLSLDRALGARRAGAVARALRESGLNDGRVTISEGESRDASVTLRLSPAATD
jgi:outer membrane protein OmpA-like peptidoglycan-associated protein